MTHKDGNFSEFTQLDNPWLPRLLLKEPINPGQLISMELLRWVDGKNQKDNVSLPFPQLIAFLLEKFNIKSTEGVDNRKCLPMDTKNLGKMGVSYIKPVRAAGSSSRGGSASHNTRPSTSGAADQEVESHRRPSTSAAAAGVNAATLDTLADELIFKMHDALQTSFQEQVRRSFNKLHHRIKKVQAHLYRVEAKVDLLLVTFCY